MTEPLTTDELHACYDAVGGTRTLSDDAMIALLDKLDALIEESQTGANVVLGATASMGLDHVGVVPQSVGGGTAERNRFGAGAVTLDLPTSMYAQLGEPDRIKLMVRTAVEFQGVATAPETKGWPMDFSLEAYDVHPDLRELLEGDAIPYHLRSDSKALAACSVCERETWTAEAVGKPCGMTQPDGKVCLGTMEEFG